MTTEDTAASTTTRHSRWRRVARFVGRAGLVMVLLLALVLVVVTLGLRSRSVRMALVDRATGALATSTGVEATIEDVSIALWRGRVVVEGVALYASEATTGDAPFLTLARAEVDWRWSAIVGEPSVVSSVVLEGPFVDLTAPLPTPPAAEDDASSEPGRRFEISEIIVRGGGLVAAPADEAQRVWLDRLQIAELSLDARLTDGRFTAENGTAAVRVTSDRRPPIEATLESALSVGNDGFRIDRLTLAGDDLSFSASGDGALDPEGPASLRVRIEAAPAALWPDLVASGRVSTTADLSWQEGTVSGDLDIDLAGIPGALFAPALPAGVRDQLQIDDTVLDTRAVFALAATLGEAPATAVLTRLVGDAEVTWRRGDEHLIDGTLQASELATGDAVQLRFDGSVLPAFEGRRALVAALEAPAWERLIDGRLRDARLDVEVPDPAAAGARLGASAQLVDRLPSGSLDLALDASGALTRPELTLDARWWLDRPRDELVRIDAATRGGVDPSGPLVLDIAVEALAADAGERTFASTLMLDDLGAVLSSESETQLDGLVFEDATLTLDVPDARRSLDDLASRLERLLPGTELPEALAADAPIRSALHGPVRIVVRGAGPVSAPEVEIESSWAPGDGERLVATVEGKAFAGAPFFDGDARVDLTALSVTRLAELAGLEQADEVGGSVSLDVRFEGTPAAHEARLDLSAERIALGGDLPELEVLSLAVVTDGAQATITALEGRLASGQILNGRGTVTLPHQASSAPGTETPSGELWLSLARPIETLRQAVLRTRVQPDGAIDVQLAIEEAEDGASLDPVARLASTWAALVTAEEPRRASLVLDGLRLAPFLPLLGLEEGDHPRARLDADLTIDLDRPFDTAGTLVLDDLAWVAEDGRIDVLDPLRLSLADARLTLAPSRLLAARGDQAPGDGERDLTLEAVVDLDPDWRADDASAASLVRQLDARLAGSFDSAQLDPLLGGGRAAGDVTVALTASGPLDRLRLDGRLNGPQASFFLAEPYPTRLEAPTLRLSSDGRTITLEQLGARLNDGTVAVSGTLVGDDGTTLETRLDDVRYRVDHGLSTLFDAGLSIRLPADAAEPGRIAGEVVLDRAVLRRDVAVDRSLLALLLAPDMTSAAAGAGRPIDLHVDVVTAEGLRVKNNLGDLRADWNRLRIRGTAAQPLIAGRIDVDPGGTLSAFGQTVRIDDAWAIFSGEPGVGPRLVLDSTSSLDDPTVGRGRRGFGRSRRWDRGPAGGRAGIFDQGEDASGPDAGKQLTRGLLDHYADQLAGRFVGGLDGTELGLQPLPIFGETDTQARLTATQRLSRWADLIYSVDPRDAEGQTYLLELHSLSPAPGLAVQLFNDDEDEWGAAVVETFALGGGPPPEAGPRLRRLVVEAPAGVSRRRLRRSLGLRRGDALTDVSAFDLEIEARDALRRQGFPGATVRVDTTPVDSAARPSTTAADVDVSIQVVPGQPVRFVFEGERLPRAARQRIAQQFRARGTERSLRRMEQEARRALQAEGFLDPDAHAEVHDDLSLGQVVRVRATGGRKLALDAPVVLGVEPQVAAEVAAGFTSMLARIELAAGAPGADAYLAKRLRARGYPEARVRTRRLSEDGHRLEVEVDAGPRQQVASVVVDGAPTGRDEALRAVVRLAEGDPLRADRVTLSAHALGDLLRAWGHAEARVETSLAPVADHRPHALRVRFVLTPGPVHRVADTTFGGLRATRAGWASKVAGLAPGDLLTEDALGDARRRLTRTGLFERIRVSTDPPLDIDPDAPPSTDAPEARSTAHFEVTERRRFQISTGVRWQQEDGIGAVVEAIDQNLLGRGTVLGVRAAYLGADERSLRLFHAVPRFLGTPAELEVFVEGKRERFDDALADSTEAWAQLTFPLGRRATSRVYLRHQDVTTEPRSDAPGGAVESSRFRIPTVGWQLSIDSRARAIGARPAVGRFLALDVNGTDEALGSDLSAFGFFAQGKWVRGIGGQIGAGRDAQPRLTWGQALRAGVLLPSSDTEIPATNLLRAGGEHSVRGYRRDGLGPLDANGNATGGEAYVVLNQELHFPVWTDRQLSGLVFFDAGNVWAGTDDLSDALRTSLGFGLRFKSPLGPLRFDVAFPLDRREGDDSVRYYFGFGNIF